MRKHRRSGKLFGGLWKQLVCVALSLVVLIPFYMVVLNSFKNRLDSSRMNIVWPAEWLMKNYAAVIEKANMVRGFLNSLTYAGISTLAAVLLCAMAAFVICRNRSRLNHFVYYFVLLGLFLPVNYVTLIRILKAFGLYDTKTGMVLVFTAGMIPFCVFVIRNFVSSLPVELDEAAVLDGCGPLTLFFRVIFPLMRPVLVTCFLLEFMGVWSDFLSPLYLTNSQTKWPMSLAVYSFFSKNVQNWNYVFACVVLTVLPVVLVYLAGQKWIVEGMTSGSVKQ